MSDPPNRRLMSYTPHMNLHFYDMLIHSLLSMNQATKELSLRVTPEQNREKLGVLTKLLIIMSENDCFTEVSSSTLCDNSLDSL